jgi:hypothetical protein
MSTIADRRAALAAAAASISGLRSLAYMPDAVNPPQAVVLDGDTVYDADSDGSGANGATYHFTVIVFAGRVAERSADTFLDTLREPSGATSMKATIEGATGVAAVCDWVVVTKAGPTQKTMVGETEYLAAAWDVEMTA